MDLVRVPGWERYGWLRHGFSTRLGGVSRVYGGEAPGAPGVLNLGMTAADEPEAVCANRRALAAAVMEVKPGVELPLAMVSQVHGVEIVDAAQAAGARGDGVTTGQPGVLVGVQAADCAPVLMADVRRRVVGAFHAGWRGTVAGMAGAGVRRMVEGYGCRAEDLIAAVGPAIGVCCYEVGEEVLAAFAALPGGSGLVRGRYVDLAEANRRQLVEAGVPPAAIELLGLCTACSFAGAVRRFFSHRAEGGVTGRAMGLIGVAAEVQERGLRA